MKINQEEFKIMACTYTKRFMSFDLIGCQNLDLKSTFFQVNMLNILFVCFLKLKLQVCRYQPSFSSPTQRPRSRRLAQQKEKQKRAQKKRRRRTARPRSPEVPWELFIYFQPSGLVLVL